MIASLIIVAFSLALLLYWFRYSCILMLRNAMEARTTVAANSQFSCWQVKELLGAAVQFDTLERALDRDYRLATYLIEHASELDLNTIEDRLLVLDYRVMQWYYRMTRSAAPNYARRALVEMADVVGVLAGRLDERAALRSEV